MQPEVFNTAPHIGLVDRGVSIPQAVGTVATDEEAAEDYTIEGVFQYRKR